MSHKLLSCTSIAVGLALAAMTASASANLVVNGGFEDTTLTASGGLEPGNLTGWTSTKTGTLGNGQYNFAALFFSGNDAMTVGAAGTDHPVTNWAVYQAADSPDGGKFVAIDGDPRVNSSLSQVINGLIVGHDYNLSFYYAGAQENDRSGPTTETWKVTFGNQTSTAPILQNLSQGFTGWYGVNMSFEATSTSELLTFLAVGTPTGFPPISLLDGVSLTDATSIPEPGSWALVLLALGAVGWTARAQRKAGVR